MPSFDLVGYLDQSINGYNEIIGNRTLPEYTRKSFEHFKAVAEWLKAINTNAPVSEIVRLSQVKETKAREANEAMNRYLQQHPELAGR